MIRFKGAAPALLCVMLVAAIVVIITDVFLVLSVISPLFRVWPLTWYQQLVLPPASIHQTVRNGNHVIERTRHHRSARPRSNFALPAKSVSNATFVFHIFPGAGSGVIMELIESLQELHPGQIAHIKEMSRLSFPPIKQWAHWQRVRNLLIKVIVDTPKPCVVFVESPVFLTINVPNVHYLSVMYDPAERLQNHYNLDHWGDDLSNYMHPNWPEKPPVSFTRCIQSQGRDCSYAMAKYFYTLWFCGFDKNPKCVNKKEIGRASILAKNTVENFFLVGVMENLDKFIVSLEQLVPSVFQGLEELYLSDKFTDIHKHFVPKRNNSLGETYEAKIKHTLKEDYALYNFTKSHLEKQYRTLTGMRKPSAAVEDDR